MQNKKIILIVYICALVLSIGAVEFYIYNKKKRLFSEKVERLEGAFNNIRKEKSTIEALDFQDIEAVDYTEIPIPKLAENISKQERRYWENRFSGIKHLYKLDNVGWQMIGDIIYPVPYKNRACFGIIEYFYSPYMIGVPANIPFDNEIAKKIIQESLNRVYCSPDDLSNFIKEVCHSNEYYSMVGHHMADSISKVYTPFIDNKTGTGPIMENNEYTGKHWFGIQKIGPYRVLLSYQHRFGWMPEEKSGFNASLKDRIIYYSFILFVFILLTILLIHKNKIQEETEE